MSSSGKRRRDSTRIIYEILQSSKNGISKTRMVHESNLNFRLVEKYLKFLLDKKYLERTTEGESFEMIRTTEKGLRFLDLLMQLEVEVQTFRGSTARDRWTNGRPREESQRHLTGQPSTPIDLANHLGRTGLLRGDQEYQVSLALIQLFSLQGQVSREESVIDQVLKLARILSDNSRLAEAHVWKSSHLTRVGQYESAMVEGQIALNYARIAADRSKVAGAQLALGEASSFLGMREESLGYFSKALSYYREQSDLIGQANASRLTAQVYLKHNEFGTALDQANNSLRLFREMGDRVGEDEALRYIGDICCARGDYLDALDYYERVLRIRREVGNHSREGGALGDIGDVYLSLGQYEKSLELHQQALAIDTEVRYRFGQIWDHHDIGVLCFHLGNLSEALRELTVAVRQAKDLGAPDLIALSLGDLSSVFRNSGEMSNLEKALQSALEAAKIGDIYSLPFGQITGESNMAMAHRALGNPKEALYHSEKAIKLLEGMGPTEVLEEEILFNHFLILQDNHKMDGAKDFLKRAHGKMMLKASRIMDPDTRKTFLSRVTVNRNLTAAWRDREQDEAGITFPTLRHADP